MKTKIYQTREELLKEHPHAQWHEHGPVHKHGDGLYVQVYLGQHEWISINVEDASKTFYNPGWEGTEFGWGYIPEESVNWHPSVDEDIAPPEREGKPITSDQWLFADLDKLTEYLGPDDPIIEELTKKES